MDKIFLTGGSGYIGTHLIKLLLEKKYQVIIFDNLSSGYLKPVKILKDKFENLELIQADLKDKETLIEIFQKQNIDIVVHLAAKIDVNESIRRPELYYQENYLNSIYLLEAMTANGINKLIFSSTAAVYGEPQYIPIDENHPTNPTNPYGQTKLDFEKYLGKFKNLKYIILRYFNVGGSDPEGLIGKSHLQSSDLIENIMKVALGQQKLLQIFGNDYKIRDGTAIRDFIHISDVAEAHLLALEKIESLGKDQKIFNLGSDKGFTVKETIDQAEKVIGKKLPREVVARRPGDVAVSVASSKRAKSILGWEPKYSDLETIISTDWHWRKSHSLGYTK